MTIPRSALRTFLLGTLLVTTPGPAAAQDLVATVGVGNTPGTVAVNPFSNRIYVVNEEGFNVTVIDGATNSAVGTISVAANRKPRSIAVDASSNTLYVTHYFSRMVSIIDLATNTLTTTIASEPIGRGSAHSRI